MPLLSSLTSREYHEGSTLANVLGLQVARAIAINRQVARTRRALTLPASPEAEIFAREGVITIPDFLPPDVFAGVTREYHAARDAGLLEAAECEEDNGIVERRIRIARNKAHFPATRAAFMDNRWLLELVGLTLGRIPDAVSLLISVMARSEEPTHPARLIGSNYLHADVHFPTVKAWLYLADIDERNGAFRYVRGSHRLTLWRMAYEYESSIRVSRTRRHHDVGRDIPYGKVRTPTPVQVARMALEDEPVCGSANTLVVANTMGFHRRGEFPPGVTREMLHIRFGDRKQKTPATVS